MTYDKTTFQPQTISTLDRYGFSLPESQSDANSASESESGSAAPTDTAATGSESKETATTADAVDDAPAQQFDLGDFSDLKPNDESTTKPQEDVAPLLDGPSDEPQ